MLFVSSGKLICLNLHDRVLNHWLNEKSFYMMTTFRQMDSVLSEDSLVPILHDMAQVLLLKENVVGFQ